MLEFGQPKRWVTIKDVARAVNVSASTVSNVLNGRTGAMTPETLQRIREAIRILNYRPSSAARGLVTKRMTTIGLILAEIETSLFLQAVNVIEPIARSAGYNLLLSNARSPQDERLALDLQQKCTTKPTERKTTVKCDDLDGGCE